MGQIGAIILQQSRELTSYSSHVTRRRRAEAPRLRLVNFRAARRWRKTRRMILKNLNPTEKQRGSSSMIGRRPWADTSADKSNSISSSSYRIDSRYFQRITEVCISGFLFFDHGLDGMLLCVQGSNVLRLADWLSRLQLVLTNVAKAPKSITRVDFVTDSA